MSFNTKADYKRIVKQAIEILHEKNFHIDSIYQLKQKHIQVLVESYRHTLNPRSIKNRISALRCCAQKMNKFNLVPDNAALELPKVNYTNDKQIAVFQLDLNQFKNEHIRYSIALQQAFGLRREECLKFNANFADKGEYILLKASWTKGGIERTVPVTNSHQRALLDEIKAKFPSQSLIPKADSYIKQRQRYDKAVALSDYQRLHGLRHAYAQLRYFELTGWYAPKQGGKTFKHMSASEKAQDKSAREIISVELGHSRVAVTRTYLG